MIAEIGERVVPGVAAVDEDAAAGRIVETQEEGEQGRLAGAAGSDDGDLLTGLGVELDPLKDLDAGAGGVGEVDVLEGHFAAETGEGGGGLGGEGGLDLGSFAEEFADPLGGADSLLDLAVEVGELAHGTGHEGRVEDEPGEFAEGDLAGLQETSAAPEDEDNRPEKGEHDERDERGAQTGAAERGFEEPEEAGVVAAEFVGFVGEGLHVDDALEGFLDDGGGLGETILGLAGEPAGPAAEEDGDQRQDGQAGQHDAGQLQRGDADEHDATGEERHLTEELRQERDESVLDLDEVGGESAGEFADPSVAEERHRKRDQAGVDIASQVDDGALPHGGEGQRMEEQEAGLDGEDADEEEGGAVDAGAGAVGGVDEGTGQVGESEAEEVRAEEREQGEDEPDAVRTEVAEEFEDLGEGFAVESSLGKVDTGLIIPRVARHSGS